MTGRRVGLALLILGALGVSGVMCQRVSDRGRFAVPYSSFGSGPEGTRALFLLAEALGARPSRHTEDVASLPPGGVLLALGGCERTQLREVSRYERRAIAEWVAAGGTLIVAGAHDYLSSGEDGVGVWLQRVRGECDPQEGLLGTLAREERGQRRDATEELEELGERFADDPDRAIAELFEEEAPAPATWVAVEGGPFEGLPAVPLRGLAKIELADGVSARRLLSVGDQPAAVEVSVGRGTVVAIGSASAFQNRALDSADGGVLFARLLRAYAPRGPVHFDEYHLGVGARRSLVRYLRQVGLGPAAAQLAIVIALLLWAFAARFGATRAAPAPEPAGTASYLGAIGTLYRKSDDPAGAIAILSRHALWGIARRKRAAAQTPSGLERELGERGDVEAALAVRRIDELGRRPIRGRAALVAVAKELDDLVARAAGAPGPPPSTTETPK